MIYFDNAASSYPKPPTVISGVQRFIKTNGANPGRSGHKPALDAAAVVFETRCNIADMFGVKEAENVAFVPNATYGLNMLLMGILRRGDHVVTTELEHNSVLRPLNFLSTAVGIRYDIAAVDMYDDGKTVDNILSLVSTSTRAVVCTQCSNVCGKVMPIKMIASALPRDVVLVVDGSQGAGVIKTDISADGIDYYCAPSHKGLLGLQGSGFIAVNSEVPLAVITGGTGSESDSLIQPSYMPDAFESGTVATPSIVSMKYSTDFIKFFGVDKIYSHKRWLTRYLDEKLCDIRGVTTYVDTGASDFVGTVCFNVSGKHSDETAAYLAANGICVRSGLHCAPFVHKKFGTERSGAVRVSFSCFNTKNEIDELIKTINKYIKL